MALPTTIATTDLPQRNIHIGPFISAGGDVYVVILDSTASSKNPQVFKATDPESSFSIQDSGNEPTGTDIQSMWVDQDSDLLHIISADTVNLTAIEYHRFDMSSDTWTTTNDLIDSFSGSETPTDIQKFVSITHRGSGDPIVALHTSLSDKNMGTNYSRLSIATRSGGGTWTDRGLVFGAATDELHYRGASSITGTSDGTHIFCYEHDGSNADLLGRTFDSSNSLSTTIRLTSVVSNTTLGMVKCITYDDAGTQRVYVPYISATTTSGPGSIWRGEENGSNDFINTSVVRITDTSQDVRHVNNSLLASLALDSTTAHFIWSNFDDTQDLYHDEAASPHGTSDWGTDVEERDAVTVNLLSGNIFTRSSEVKYAFIYDNAGVTTYDEIVLSAGGGAQVWPSPTKQMAHLLNR